jgi:hypothetical protein
VGVSAETPGLRPTASVWDVVFDEPIGSGPLEIGGRFLAFASSSPTQRSYRPSTPRRDETREHAIDRHHLAVGVRLVDAGGEN